MGFAFFTAASHWLDIFIKLSTSTPKSRSWSAAHEHICEIRSFCPTCISLPLFILNCASHFTADSLSLESSCWSSLQTCFGFSHPEQLRISLDRLLGGCCGEIRFCQPHYAHTTLQSIQCLACHCSALWPSGVLNQGFPLKVSTPKLYYYISCVSFYSLQC